MTAVQKQQANTQLLRMGDVSTLLADFAVQALLDEVHTTPKPGLVDCRNSGAHRDMDLDMFERSAAILRPYFEEVAKEGIAADDCMPRLQQLGLEAEHMMYQETGGINTHKGAIYALGLFAAAAGACYLRGGNLFDRVSRLAGSALLMPTDTHGAEVKRKYCKGGAQAAALDGFPAAQYAYRLLAADKDSITVLLHIMATLDDTNLLYRGGLEGLVFAQTSAKEILSAPKELRANLIMDLDNEFIQRNLSPGGSADMLAAGFYLRYTDSFWKTQESELC